MRLRGLGKLAQGHSLRFETEGRRGSPPGFTSFRLQNRRSPDGGVGVELWQLEIATGFALGDRRVRVACVEPFAPPTAHSRRSRLFAKCALNPNIK